MQPAGPGLYPRDERIIRRALPARQVVSDRCGKPHQDDLERLEGGLAALSAMRQRCDDSVL